MKKLIFFSLLSLFVGCKSPNLLLSPDLKTNTSVFDVKGVQGFQFKQVITYGDYFTSKVKRSWTVRTEIPFIIKFEKAHEKLSFVQTTADKKQADVFAVSKFKNNELSLLNGFLSYSIKYQNVFAGTILPQDDKINVWEFIVSNFDAGFSNNENCGSASDGKDNFITIKGISKVEGNINWIKSEYLGYEFIRNEQSIGAVSCLNNGRVWIKDDISPELKLIISCILV